METSRRQFLKTTLAGSLLLAAEGKAAAAVAGVEKKAAFRQSLCSIMDNRMKIFSAEVHEPVKLLLVADTHLWMSDSREDPYRQYSARMAKAYNETKHFRTGEPTDPKQEFLKTMELAKQMQPDAICLLGDIVSYPSEAAIDWVKCLLDDTGIPYYYINGNHDWHYEGMPGTEIELRREWTRRRLSGLFNGRNPLFYTDDVKGVRIMMLDNSTYEILPEQLTAFRNALKDGKPSLLMSHIPFYAPGFSVGFGCGHPDWNASTDHGYEVERRPQWPAEGHKPETFQFWREVIKAHQKHNLLATIAGHVHTQTMSLLGGWPQFTLKPNLTGAYCELTVEPMPDKLP